MKCTVKWTLTMLPLGLIYLAQGLQFTIILPTLFDYIMVHFEGQEWMYSLAVSATSLSNVVVGPILGILYDRTHASKLLIVFTLVCAAIGAFLYFAAVSPYMVIGGRLLQGFALSSGTVISGEVSRITTKKERTAVFSSLTAITQIGYVLGPGFNVFLRYCDFQVGPFAVNKDRSPALFIVVYWTVTAILFLAFYFHMPTVEEEEEDDGGGLTINDSVSSYHEEMDEKSLASDYSERARYKAARARGYEILEVTGLSGIATRVPYSRRNSLSSVHTNGGVVDYYGVTNSDSLSKNLSYSLADSEKSESRSEYFHRPGCCGRMYATIRRVCSRVLTAVSMLLWEEIVVLYFIILIMMFSQISVEVAFTPIAQNYFKWGEDGISIFFSATGVLMIVVSVVLSILSKRVQDKWMVMTGLIAQFIVCSWLFGWFYFFKTVNITLVLSQFIIGTTISLLTEPITLGSAVSLFSKKVALEVQGIGHGLRRSMVSLGSVIGSLWAAAALQLDSTELLYGGPIGLIALATLLSILSFKRLNG